MFKFAGKRAGIPANSLPSFIWGKTYPFGFMNFSITNAVTPIRKQTARITTFWIFDMLTDWPDIPEPGNEPVKVGDHRIVLEAQVVDLHLFFESDKTEVVVVISDPEFLAFRYTFDLLPQCLVIAVIEIDAPYPVAPVFAGMRIRLHYQTEPFPHRHILSVRDLELQLMPVVPVNFHSYP